MRYNFFTKIKGEEKMNECLFIAEADKIQDLLFCSSKLREVAGGSQMLTEFCESAVPFLIKRLEGTEIISAGGSFRICFNSNDKAEEFGEYLSELYRRELGGTITIAKPIEVTDKQNEVIKNAQKSLRKAKHYGKNPISVEQIPYSAICASCGTGIARHYENQFEDEKPNYLCEMCFNKTNARKYIKKSFLSRFSSYIDDGTSEELEFPNDADEIAKFESRNYVAYLIADANSMGTIFNACDSFIKMGKLSKDLNNVICDSLAEPTKILMEKQKEFISQRHEKTKVPILPLILGGDDLFALIPAKWALDFTRRFAQEFDIKMKRSIEEIGIQSSMPPTISAAVIICKRNFPYLIAYEQGEELLKIAKKRAKELTMKEKSSTISFKLIKGNEIVKSAEEENRFVSGFPAYTTRELEELIKYRYRLNNLPGTRRGQLESMFLREDKLDFNEMEDKWIAERERILSRLENELKDPMNEAIKYLGNPTDKQNWLWINGIRHHKLSDLLVTWDYTYNLEEDMLEYEVEE